MMIKSCRNGCTVTRNLSLSKYNKDKMSYVPSISIDYLRNLTGTEVRPSIRHCLSCLTMQEFRELAFNNSRPLSESQLL